MSFIFDLGCKSLVEFMRGCLTAATAAFQHETRMSNYLTLVSSLQTVVQACTCDNEASPFAPSLLKQALEQARTLTPPPSPLVLSLQHGAVGIEVLRRAQGHIGAGGRDDAGVAKFNSAYEVFQSAINKADCDHDFDPKKIQAAMYDMASAVEMWGKTTREMMQPKVMSSMTLLATILEKMVEHCMHMAGSDLSEEIDKLLDSVRQLIEGSTSGATDKSEMPQLHNGGRDRVEEFLEKWQSTVSAFWLQLVDMLEVASKMQSAISTALAQAGVDTQFATSFQHMHTEGESVSEGILLIRHVMTASTCIFEGVSSVNFQQLLNDWTNWADLKDDAKREVGTPALQRMLEGAKAVRELKACASARAHLSTSAPRPNNIDLLAQKILQHQVSSEFYAMVKGNMSQALGAVHSQSKLGLLSLQEASTIRRQVEAGRFQEAAAMLLQGASSPAVAATSATTALDSLKGAVMPELEKSDFALKPDTNWPQRASIQMASECLRMLVDSIGGEWYLCAPHIPLSTEGRGQARTRGTYSY